MSDVRCQMSDIRHPSSVIRYPSSDIPQIFLPLHKFITMDNFFWTTLVTDVIHAFMIVGLGCLAAWVLIAYYFRLKNSYRKSAAPVNTDLSESKRITLPLRLQAYERIVLFLERIQPSNLVLRIQKPEMSSQELHLALVRTIREEFEYNLSQQVYLSATAWEMIKNAREESVAAINRASGTVDPAESSALLVRAIFDVSMENEHPATAAALNFIKDEARLLM